MNRVYPLDNLKSKLVETTSNPLRPPLMYEVLKYSPPNEALLFLQGQWQGAVVVNHSCHCIS